jgi:hypothetical protein
MKFATVTSLMFLVWIGCKGLGQDDDAQRPIIDRLTASPASLKVGDTTVVTAEARDPQGEDLVYVWTKEDGTFIGDLTGPVVQWKAPVTPGTYDVLLRVTNESNKSASRTLAIIVTQAAEPVIVIESPTDGEYIASSVGTVTIEAATPQQSDVDSMRCYIDGQLRSSASAPDLTYTWDVSQENGSKNITIYASRPYLGGRVSSQRTITVSIEGTIPKRP